MAKKKKKNLKTKEREKRKFGVLQCNMLYNISILKGSKRRGFDLRTKQPENNSLCNLIVISFKLYRIDLKSILFHISYGYI